MRRAIPLCSRYFFCGEKAETVSDLFLHCTTTRQLWRIFLNLKGISRTMPGKISKALKRELGGGKSTGKRQKYRRIVPAYIWWTIWKEGNSICFEKVENVENSMQSIKLNCILTLCFLCKKQ